MLDGTFFPTLLHIVAEAAPYLLLGFAAAGALRALIPEERIYAWLGEDRPRSVLLASLLGVPLPLCSCSVIPVATGLRQGGAGRGATTSFLISTPETGVDSISITWALMDPLMTIARPLAAFGTALVTGAAVAMLPGDGTAHDGAAINEDAGAGNGTATGEAAGAGRAAAGDAAPAAASCCADDGCASSATSAPGVGAPASRRESLRDGLRYAFGPLVDDLALWLIGGFILAAAVAAAIPDGFFAAIPGGWISSLLMMLLATPIYICASAATPVAAAMILKGLDPGAALVFLLVGPATNVTTILVVLRFLGRRVLAIYLLGVTSCALAFGAAVNLLYDRWGIDPAMAVGTEQDARISVLQGVAAIVLVALLAYRGGRKLSALPALRRASDTFTMLR